MDLLDELREVNGNLKALSYLYRCLNDAKDTRVFDYFCNKNKDDIDNVICTITYYLEDSFMTETYKLESLIEKVEKIENERLKRK